MSFLFSLSLFSFQIIELKMTSVNSISGFVSPGLRIDTGSESSTLESTSPISQCVSSDIGDCVDPTPSTSSMLQSSHHESSSPKVMNNVMQQLQTELTQLQKYNVELKPTSKTTPSGCFLASERIKFSNL